MEIKQEVTENGSAKAKKQKGDSTKMSIVKKNIKQDENGIAFKQKDSSKKRKAAQTEVKTVEKRLDIYILSIELFDDRSSIINRNDLIEEVVIIVASFNSIEGNCNYCT